MPLITRFMVAIFHRMSMYYMLLLGLCAFSGAYAMESPATNQPAFIENKGQFSPTVLFTAQTNTTSIWITTSGIVYDFHNNQSVVPMDFPACTSVHAQGIEQRAGVMNNFMGKNSVTGIRSYASLLLSNVAPGVDMKWYFENGNPRYDFIVRPNSKPEDFSFILRNVDNVSTTENGDLALVIGKLQVQQKGLLAYQQEEGARTKIPCEFTISKQAKRIWKIGFDLGKYNEKKPLVIDPVVVGSFFGSVGNDKVNDVKVDEAGNIYIGGSTTSPSDLPNIVNKNRFTLNKASQPKLDGFVAKFSPEGKNLIYYCTIGGAGDDEILSIVIDKSGGVIAGGYTYSDTSRGFPITPKAPDSILVSGDVDGFIVAFKDDGSRLGFSTYYGGERADTVKKIILDEATGMLYVAGTTEGNSIANKTTDNYGGENGFYGRMNISSNEVLYTYLLGGSRNDAITDMELFNGNIYLAGYTMSADIEALNNNYISDNDGFYSVVDQATGQILFTHIYGGLGNDKVWGIAVDAAGTITIAGTTNSPTLEVTTTAFAGAKIGGDDGFVAQFSPNSVMLYASLIGGSSDDEIFDVKIDAYGQIYLLGNTQGLMSVPKVSADADFTISLGSSECYLAVINPKDPLTFNYLTYFGGSSNDYSRSIALANNHVYCAGFSNSNDFRPLGGYSSQFKGGLFDGFIAVLDLPFRKPTLLPSNINYGKVTVNSIGKIDSVIVKSRNFKPISIKSTTPNLPFYLIRPLGNVSIDPADSAMICYKYLPQTTGVSAAVASIQYGSTASEELLVRLSGEGIASAITLSTEILDFGQVQVDSLKILKINVFNTGTAPGLLHFSSIQSSVFSYKSTTPPGDTIIPAGGHIQVEIEFTPPIIGIFSDTLKVESNGIMLKSILKGEGIVSQFRWVTDTVQVGNVRVGTTSQGIISLKNIGKAQGKISDVFSLGNKTFSLVPVNYPVDSLINPGDSINFTVLFSPIARGFETETILANTSTGQLKTYISGKGVFPVLQLQTIGNIDFKSINVNAVKFDSVVIVNVGDATDTLNSVHLSTIFTPFILSAFPPKFVIAPKQKVIVFVRFSPLFPGVKRDTITIDCATATFTTYVDGVGIASQFKIADTVRFGNTKVHAKSTQTIYLKNTGTAAGLVGNIYLTDTTNSFSLIGRVPQDFELAPNDSSPITIEYHPEVIGLQTAMLSIRADGIMLNSYIRGESYGAVFETYPADLDFSSIQVGSSLVANAKIYNSGNISQRPEMKIVDDPEGNFQLLSTAPSVKFHNRDSIFIRFTPRTKGLKTAAIKVWGGIGDTATVRMTGVGFVKIKPTPLLAELSMPDSIFASIGEHVTVPIILKSLTGSFIERIKSYSGTLRYNSTVLGISNPADTSLVIYNDTALLGFQGILKIPKIGDTLSIVTFTVGLGNSSVTEISLQNFTWNFADNDSLESTVIFPKSTLTVTDIWSIDGKQRLYYSTGKFILELTPNTVQKAPILIHCSPYLPSNSLVIYDVAGRFVESLSHLLSGNGELSYDPRSLSKGTYFCVFQSGRNSLVRQFVVE